MSTDIITTLQLDKDVLNQVILVNEINGCDSSFIVSCLIGHQIRTKTPTLLITAHNTLEHYHNVGIKMNYNLKRCVDTQLITYYNLGEDAVNNLLNNKQLNLHEIFVMIKEKASQLMQKSNSLNIIFDGVSHLFDLQFSLRDIVIFVRKLIELVRQNNSFLFLQSNVANDDDQTYVLSNFISHMAQTTVDVVNLPTGLSADISGHLVIKHLGQKFDSEFMHIMDSKPSTYHFKLFEKGVKLFAPGVV